MAEYVVVVVVGLVGAAAREWTLPRWVSHGLWPNHWKPEWAFPKVWVPTPI